ncbi:MAG: Fe-S protein assembly chaperone HscA [Rickettsiales bacterium]
MLIDIQEPEQSKPSSIIKPAVGIDLGTTRSLIAFKNKDVKIAKQLNGKNYLNSAVRFSQDKWQISDSRENALLSFKRHMGKSTKENMVQLNYGGENSTPVELSSVVLSALMHSTKDNFGKEFTDAVITVPAYFDDAARSDTYKAAKLAGVNVLRLLNEPTAAALAYGIENNKQGTYLIYDLGGGTFDVSLLKIMDGVFKVIATNGDTMLGGDDIDDLLADYLSKELDTQDDNLKHEAKKAKEILSSKDLVEIKFDNKSTSVNLHEYEKLITPLIDRTIKLTEDTLKTAKAKADNIDGIILIGGSSRIPLIKKKLTDKFNCKILDDINPDEAVAKGAAIQAYNLTHETDDLLLDVIPLSLGIEVMGGLNDKIIERNTTIPFSTKKEFTTYADGQAGMQFHIVQGERELAKDCRSLCKFEIKDLPRQVAGSVKIAVDFNIDSNGILNITATDKTNNIYKEVEINPSFGMKDSEINKMLDDSLKYAREDVSAKLLAESKIHAEQIMQYIEKYLKEDRELLSEESFKKISKQITTVKESIRNKNRNEIDNNVELLEKLTSNFIQDRMNKYLMRDLEGKNITLVEEIFKNKKT